MAPLGLKACQRPQSACLQQRYLPGDMTQAPGMGSESGAPVRRGGVLQNKYGAQRALQRNGVLVSRELMVGVQLLEPRMRSQLGASLPMPSPALHEPSTALGAISSSSALSSQSHVPPKQHVQQQLRPHRIQAASAQVRSAPWTSHTANLLG